MYLKLSYDHSAGSSPSPAPIYTYLGFSLHNEKFILSGSQDKSLNAERMLS
jgi:hypothetical protein